MSKIDFMRIAFQLAKKGLNKTGSNPMVGAVVVKNNKIIGRGFHAEFGGPHAEVNAIKDAEDKGFSVANSKMFVTLEPCCYFKKKTPPCTQLIVKKGIKEVIIGMKDPNTKVNGKGIGFLKKHRIKTQIVDYQAQNEKLNKGFINLIRNRIPYVTLKICLTMDGKIYNLKKNGESIGDLFQLEHANLLRKEYNSVLVGINTIINDDPQLTYRGKEKIFFEQPRPIVLDSHLRIPLKSKIINLKNSPIIFTKTSSSSRKFKALTQAGCKVVTMSALEPQRILRKLSSLNIQSVLIEGGGKVFSNFLKSKLWNELIVYYSPKFLGKDGLSVSHYLDNEFLIDNKEIKIKKIGKCFMLKIS